MMYTITINCTELHVSDSEFGFARKKPTLAIMEGNALTKLASFNDREAMMEFLRIFGVRDGEQNEHFNDKNKPCSLATENGYCKVTGCRDKDINVSNKNVGRKMTADEAKELLNEMLNNCLGIGNHVTYVDPKRFRKADALKYALECMERCKRIDEEELRDVWGWDEYKIGWNDCLKWAKGEANDN